MIGVICRDDQQAVVEEFFELFKTEWAFHRQGRAYDVVVATTGDLPDDVDARLLVIYATTPTSRDARHGFVIASRHPGSSLCYAGIILPIYRELATFDGPALPCVAADSGTAGVSTVATGRTVVRLGYDLFEEARFLLSGEQPLEQAHVPTLDVHIMMLREWILSAGIPLVEVVAAPAGHPFIACLTHDIDFAGIRNHRFDHSMWGFVYRATVGAVRNRLRGRLSLRRLLGTWRALASLPLVYLGWARDFWSPFEWYLRTERGLPVTYFLIPFKGRAGERVPGAHAERRAAAYDLAELAPWTSTLMSHGCELGVHGIDAWHSVERAREERDRIAGVTGEPRTGVRMHWLLRDAATFGVLEEAGYAYDSTVGYNETVGYRAGTTQVFRPLGATTLLELPMHIQDGALFYPQRLDLSEAEAWARCRELIDNARELGGVLTVLWHDRSHGPERFWGDFYVKLVEALRSSQAWFGTAAQVVAWFRKRREVRFERVDAADGTVRVCLRYHGEEILPALTVRIHRPYAAGDDSEAPRWTDITWTGAAALELESAFAVEEGVYVS